MLKLVNTPRFFTVIGNGMFPFDMLCYDACWPLTSADANELTYGSSLDELRRERRVVLVTFRDNAPTIGRWKSFLWAAVLGEQRGTTLIG